MYSTSGQSFDGFTTPMADLVSDTSGKVVEALETSLREARQEVEASSAVKQEPDRVMKITSAFEAAERILAKARGYKR